MDKVFVGFRRLDTSVLDSHGHQIDNSNVSDLIVGIEGEIADKLLIVMIIGVQYIPGIFSEKYAGVGEVAFGYCFTKDSPLTLKIGLGGWIYSAGEKEGKEWEGENSGAGWSINGTDTF